MLAFCHQGHQETFALDLCPRHHHLDKRQLPTIFFTYLVRLSNYYIQIFLSFEQDKQRAFVVQLEGI